MERFAVMGRIETPAGAVSTVFDGPTDASLLVVLAHGAGAGMHSDFMRDMAERLGEEGFRVCRFNFRYSEIGRRAPDRQNVLEQTYNAVIDEVAGGYGTIVVGGKSMGGRIASTIAAGGTRVDGLVLLGYPLHPPGKPERIRKAHLKDVTVPTLFVEGTRDPFCPLPTLEEALTEVSAPTEVAVIEDGDHSFKVRKSSGRSTAEAWAEAAGAVVKWLDKTF